MNKTKILLISAILIFFAASASAQSVQAIGQWRSYLPYNKGISVSQNEKFIFYASDFSLLSIDKSDMSVRRLSKVEGLSDVGISIVKHSPGGDVLVIVYSNGNIDLMSSEALINLPFLKNTEILGDRKIYNVSFAGPARAFISTGFGLLELNTTNATFLNDVRTGTPVFDVAVYEGFIYAATGEGIYRAADAPGVNLQDFSSNWVLLGSGEGFPDDFSSSDLLVYDDKLFLNIDNRLFTYQNGALNLFYEEAGYKINFLSSEGAHLLLGLDCQLSCWTDKVIAFDAAGNATMLSQNCTSSNSAFAVEDEKGQIWFADFDNQFRMLPAINAADCAFTTFDGPPTGNIWDMDVKNGVLWLATGGYLENKKNFYPPPRVFFF